jgi:hypothetical protein
MQAEALPIDVASTRELLEEVARRLGVDDGHVKLELIFVAGRLTDGYRHHRLDAPAIAACICSRHAWSPSCPVHPPSDLELTQRPAAD